MSAQIRVGIVGAGFFGSMIAGACAGHPDFSVVAVTDVSTEAAARLASTHAARVDASYTDLAHSTDVDLVVVATPNHLHAAPAVAALEAGKSVFVEKPLAIDAADLEAIERAAAASDGTLIVGHVMRAFPGVRRMVAEARSGALGQILAVEGARRRIVHLPADAADWWKTDRRRSGGELLHEVHELDLVLWALGEPARVVSVAGAPRAHGAGTIETDDVTTLLSSSGAIGRHSVSTSAHAPEWWFRISGSDAALEADFRSGAVRRFVDGVVVETGGVFDDDASNASLREAAAQRQAYNAAGSAGPLWMRTAVTCELDEVAGAVRGTSATLVEAPALAAHVALAAQDLSRGDGRRAATDAAPSLEAEVV